MQNLSCHAAFIYCLFHILHIHMDHSRPLNLKTEHWLLPQRSLRTSVVLELVHTMNIRHLFFFFFTLTSNIVDRSLSEQLTPFLGMECPSALFILRKKHNTYSHVKPLHEFVLLQVDGRFIGVWWVTICFLTNTELQKV